MPTPKLQNSMGTFTPEDYSSLLASDLSSSYVTAEDGTQCQFLHAIDHEIGICTNILDFITQILKTPLPLAKVVKQQSGLSTESYHVSFPPKFESLQKKISSAFQHQFSEKYFLGEEIKAWLFVLSTFTPLQRQTLAFPALVDARNKKSAQQYADLFNLFIEKLIQYLRSTQYKKKIRDRNRSKAKNLNACIKLFNHLMAKFSRVLVVRLDFSMKRDPQTILKHASSMAMPYSRYDLIFLKECMTKFKNNWRNNRLLSDIKGYIFQYEFSAATGFHIHAYFFFDGNKHQEDITIAQHISDYWMKVTQNRGSTYICNLKKDQYRYCGIGMIHYSNTEMQLFLIKTFNYIVKADQFFIFSELKNFKRFQRSALPVPKANSGRPRATQSSI